MRDGVAARTVTAHQLTESQHVTTSPKTPGDAPDFVEVGEAGIAVNDAMRHQRRVQLVGVTYLD